MTTKQFTNLPSGISAFEAKHFSLAMRLLLPIAEAGSPEAQYRVAIMYQNGLGVTENPSMAAKWMESAAQQGLELAQHGLGFMYMEGECVEQAGEQAVAWFTKAAEQGLVGSQVALAMMYEEGHGGLAVDLDKAREWYRRAGFEDKAEDVGKGLS